MEGAALDMEMDQA
jgi:hypothetical protein